jgi:peptidoglycan hydrolase-like protein with peptidoglycan-binding domain
MSHRWFTPLAIAGITTLVIGSGVAQTTGSGTGMPAPAPGTTSPATTTSTPQPPASPSVGSPQPPVSTMGKTTPGSTQSDTTKPGQTGSGSMTTGSKKSSVTNGHANADQVKTLQQSLQDKGLDPGPIDGVMGPKTQAALRAYQKDQNLPQTGRTDAQTLEKLGVQH